jgi:hypothetical protein
MLSHYWQSGYSGDLLRALIHDGDTTEPFFTAKYSTTSPAVRHSPTAGTEASTPNCPPVSQVGPLMSGISRPLAGLPEVATPKTEDWV